jgi:ketosteroid isomerase-like protein
LANRSEIDRLLRELYDARLRGDLDGVCRTFSEDAKFKLAGISHHASPIAVGIVGLYEIRQWLAMLIKTFVLNDHTILAVIIENETAAVQWRANIFSRITGISVPTDVVDWIEVRNQRIVSYTEFLAPRFVQPTRLT